VVDEHAALLHLHTTVKHLTDLEGILYEADAASRNYIITGKEEFSEPFIEAKSELKNKFVQIQGLFEHDEEQARRLDELEELVRKTVDYKEQVLNTEKAGKHDEAVALIAAGTGIRLLDESKNKVAEVIEVELRNLGPQQQAAAQAQLYSMLVNVGGTLFAGVVGLILLFSISR
jgi:CHASE3 domain sensor protein